MPFYLFCETPTKTKQNKRVVRQGVFGTVTISQSCSTCKSTSCTVGFPWRHKAWAMKACRSSRQSVSTWKGQRKRTSISSGKNLTLPWAQWLNAGTCTGQQKRQRWAGVHSPGVKLSVTSRAKMDQAWSLSSKAEISGTPGRGMSHNQAGLLEQHRWLFWAPIPRAGRSGVCSVSWRDQGWDKLPPLPAPVKPGYSDPSLTETTTPTSEPLQSCVESGLTKVWVKTGGQGCGERVDVEIPDLKWMMGMTTAGYSWTPSPLRVTGSDFASSATKFCQPDKSTTRSLAQRSHCHRRNTRPSFWKGMHSVASKRLKGKKSGKQPQTHG